MITYNIPAGSTSVSIFVDVTEFGSAAHHAGADAETMPELVYCRQGAAPATLATSNLASGSAAFAAGGIFNVYGSIYRVDVPNAALADGAGHVMVSLTDSAGSPLYIGQACINLDNPTNRFTNQAARDVKAR